MFDVLCGKQGKTYSGMMYTVARQGQQAVAVVCRMFSLGVAANITLKLRLSNAVVLSILSFGCEMWGPWMLFADPQSIFCFPEYHYEQSGLSITKVHNATACT
jgi:hypothetical protein